MNKSLDIFKNLKNNDNRIFTYNLNRERKFVSGGGLYFTVIQQKT